MARQGLRLLALMVTVAALAIAPARGQDGSQTESCEPAGSKTLISNSAARVYRIPTPPDTPGRSFEVRGCAFQVGATIRIDDPAGGIHAYLPPGLSLDGTVAGVGTLACDGDEVDRCYTLLDAIDLANQGFRVGRHNAVPAAGRHGRPAVKMGSLRVKRNGSMAWIMCPEREFPETGPGAEPASRRPNCVKAGDSDRVYKVEAPGERPQLLDKGRDIDPSSLRRKGSVISWVADGKRRRATLE